MVTARIGGIICQQFLIFSVARLLLVPYLGPVYKQVG